MTIIRLFNTSASALLASLIATGLTTAQTYSELWGENGEKWTPQSRLPDFSFAGYRFGEEPLPEPKVTANVKEYGAKGDGETDDTDAFLDAIAYTDSGAILIPEGRYILSDILRIKKPNLVLRGEGPDKTVLVFVTELEDIEPQISATTGGRPTSRYSWYGGFISLDGSFRQKKLADITSEALRGDRKLILSQEPEITAGERIVVQVTDNEEGTFAQHLYSDDPGDMSEFKQKTRIRLISLVEAIEGKLVTLERTLPFDLRNEWPAELTTFNPSVSEVGIEHLTVHFPNKPYEGHFTERGRNAIGMNGVADCWVRNIRIENCDSGMFIYSYLCTIDGVVIRSERESETAETGHHGLRSGVDCLFMNFDIQTPFFHDIGTSYFNHGNVFKNGKGVQLRLDHHKGVNFENLFCNLDVGPGEEVWKSGGGRNIGRHCGARGTFWALHSKNQIPLPPKGFAPDSINIVGARINSPAITKPDGKWIEPISPGKLVPADLHAAQLERRLAKKMPVTRKINESDEETK